MRPKHAAQTGSRQEPGDWTQAPPGQQEELMTESDKTPELPDSLMGVGGQGRTKRQLQNERQQEGEHGGSRDVTVRMGRARGSHEAGPVPAPV